LAILELQARAALSWHLEQVTCSVVRATHGCSCGDHINDSARLEARLCRMIRRRNRLLGPAPSSQPPRAKAWRRCYAAVRVQLTRAGVQARAGGVVHRAAGGTSGDEYVIEVI